jgi:hypothetical protein
MKDFIRASSCESTAPGFAASPAAPFSRYAPAGDAGADYDPFDALLLEECDGEGGAESAALPVSFFLPMPNRLFIFRVLSSIPTAFLYYCSATS